MMSYMFRFAVGDWSGDGHGHAEWYTVKSTKPIAEVREAYFAAKKKYSDLDPALFCSEYEDSRVPEDVIEWARELGFKFKPDEFADDDDDTAIEFGVEEMADYVVWYLNLGDPDLKAEIVPNHLLPELHFSGFDEQKRHIEGFGYGLLSY